MMQSSFHGNKVINACKTAFLYYFHCTILCLLEALCFSELEANLTVLRCKREHFKANCMHSHICAWYLEHATYIHVQLHTHIIHRFVSKMPTPTLFLSFSLLLKVAEGIGYAMYATASLTLLTQLYLQRKGTLAVSVVAIA